MKVASLKPNKGNPRQIQSGKLELLKKSVGTFQKMMELRPIVVDENYQVLGGNMRFRAIKALGLKDIPDEWVKVAEGLTEQEKREFIIKDNAGFGEWDWDILANEWDAEELTEWGLDVPDYQAIEPEQSDAEPQIDKAAELNKKWKVKTGDLWQIGEHRLLCGDSTKREDVDRVTQGDVDAVIADPPYNVGLDYGEDTDDRREDAEFWNWQRQWFEICQSISLRQVITPGCVNLGEWILNFTPKHVAVWDKGEGANTHGRVTKFWAWEPLMCHGEFDRLRHTDVFRISALGANPGHPCPKPPTLWQDVLATLAIGETVYEPFAGSGTTLVACQNLNRKCYAIEISENYCAVILERMATAFPDLEIKRVEQAEAAKT